MKTGHEKEDNKRGKHRPRWDRRVIRLLGDEESEERMVAECQEENAMCEWSHNYEVARDLTDTSFGIAVSAFRGSFFQGSAWFVRILPGPRVAPINKVQMKPRFVMAALIIRSQAKCFPWDGECTMLIHFPESLRARWFEKSADVGPIVQNGSRSPQWCGARWCRQDTVHKCFVNSTKVVFAAMPPCGTIEVTCNQVNFLRNHDGTESEDELLGNAFLCGIDVASM